MSNIAEFANVPELSFAEGLDFESLYELGMSEYVQNAEALTGAATELGAADPRRLILMATATLLSQIGQKLDAAAKSCFLKYASGAALDNLGAFKGVVRTPAARAKVTLRFSAAAVRAAATPIPGGTRVTNGAGLFFATDTYTEIPAGAQTVDVTATATVAGAVGNGCPIGAVATIVDLVPYVQTARNIDTSSGGADVEGDDDYTRDIYNAPHAYSVAGPTAAYEWHARRSRPDVEEVKAYTPEPGEVVVAFTLTGGATPDATDIAAMEEYLSADTIRPLTDSVTAEAPTPTAYNIGLTYYIDRSKAGQATAIQAAVAAAVDDYAAWQRKIGRDIAPEQLIMRVMQAGAKRVAVTAPVTTVVDAYNLPTLGTKTVTYGGLEDD